MRARSVSPVGREPVARLGGKLDGLAIGSISENSLGLPTTQRILRLGVCAMEKKAKSKPMKEILRRLPHNAFEILTFQEDLILHAPVEDWPIVDVLIAFHSTGYPLHKAMAYVALRNPFVVNDLKRQALLRDRRHVYETLEKAGIPTPRYAAISRDGGTPGSPAASDAVEQTLEEFDDYIIVNGTRMEKPFVEKPARRRRPKRRFRGDAECMFSWRRRVPDRR
jgi:hypothetical protein